MELPAAYIRVVQDMTDEVLSARPDAPVVPPAKTRSRTPRVRLTLSRVLYRASCAVAPAGHRPA